MSEISQYYLEVLQYIKDNIIRPRTSVNSHSSINSCSYKRSSRLSIRHEKDNANAEEILNDIFSDDFDEGTKSIFIDDVPKGLRDLKTKVKDTWVECVFKIIDKNNWKDSDVYKKAGISKQTFSKIRSNNNYKCDKDTVMQICIGLMLNLDETIDLLSRAGFSLSMASERDLAFRYFIENKEYNIVIINGVLEYLGLRMFNTH